MMINKRLINTVSESKKYIVVNVALQWVSLGANILLISIVAQLLGALWKGSANSQNLLFLLVTAALAITIRIACTMGTSKMSYLSSKAVKEKLRRLIYEKLLRLGSNYKQQISTAEAVQVSIEGIDQLETYFGAYLPQFFYSILAPLTLFAVIAPINLLSAATLLVCVPLIPVTIAAVQTFAKKLLASYWGEYTTLGDSFLENLQGLTTLKIYQADNFKHEQMNQQSERFRKITMKVLTMQLNSVTIMDVIAYGGAALGVILSTLQFRAGNVSMSGCLSIILLSAEFFIPMRLLGSYFHVAMNGMAASDKIFRLLDLPEPATRGTVAFHLKEKIETKGLCFSYDEQREVLHSIDFSLRSGNLTAIVGESGSGKSTVAAVLMGHCAGYTGHVELDGMPFTQLSRDSLLENITYVGFSSCLFKGTVGDNLRMGKPNADDNELWEALSKVKLDAFLQTNQGLATPLSENGTNLSGGQRQRLAMARALLHDSQVYIFDEATSNIDVESENDIIEIIYALAKNKTVLMITHRLANARNADEIYVMEQGKIVQHGKHEALLKQGGMYARLWRTQYELEHFGEEAAV